MWYRASHARRLWQTEHTAGGIQEGKNERGSRGGCMSSEHFGQLAWQFKRVSGSSGLKVQAAIAC